MSLRAARNEIKESYHVQPRAILGHSISLAGSTPIRSLEMPLAEGGLAIDEVG